MPPAPAPRVFTIPASAPFVPTLIHALVEGKLVPGFPAAHGPLALAGATLYLPTRRTCRLAHDLFLDVTKESAAILPRIVPLGDVDEDEIAFAEAATGALAARALDLPPALGELERRLLLTQLVLRWAQRIAPDQPGEAPLVANNPAAALALADDLARLIDDMTTRGVAWERLDGLVPEALDRYWQLTLEFLQSARETGPQILAERGAIEPAARRDALIKAEAARLAAHADGPVIAAGSTGSMPATAELIAAIAKLNRGAVVLPGLDLELDAQSWDLIEGRSDTTERVAPAVEHPQFAMQALLRRIGITREQVVALGTRAAHDRERYICEALRPAAATERWQQLAGCDVPLRIDRALETVAVIEAANAGEEALAIAISLREALETPHKTAALITPDRALARRVLAALERWKIAVDDSGGDALADASAGRFARLAAEAALGGLSPVALLALIKHPLARLGAAEGAHGRAIAALEKAVLRGPRPRPGTAGLAHALAAFRAELEKLRRGEPSDLHPSDPRASLTAAELDAAAAFVARLTAVLAPLEGLAATPFAKAAALHRGVIAALSADETGAPVAFLGTDGAVLEAAFEEIELNAADADFAVALADYADVFHTMISNRPVRERELRGARLRIYGPLEARLQSVDRVVLGGLVEGVWPPEMRSDPWLSRPMRHALGLDLPERRMSLSAHDFAQALGAHEVILAYPAKLAGAPTVISRFVQRLAAVAGEEHWNRGRARSPSPTSRTGCATLIRSMPSTSSSCASSIPSTCRRARPIAASSSTARSAISPRPSRRRCPPIRPPRSSTSAPSISPRSKTIPRRGRSGGRASAASPAGLPAGRRCGAAVSRRYRPRFPARSTSRSASACSRCAPAPIASSASPAAATPFSTTRPDRCRARSRCASARRRSSRSKPRSCAAADLAIFLPTRPSPNWSTSRSKAATPRATAWRSTSRTATPTPMPTARSPSSKSSPGASRTSSNPIFRWCCRCGRAATAPTITSRG